MPIGSVVSVDHAVLKGGHQVGVTMPAAPATIEEIEKKRNREKRSMAIPMLRSLCSNHVCNKSCQVLHEKELLRIDLKPGVMFTHQGITFNSELRREAIDTLNLSKCFGVKPCKVNAIKQIGRSFDLKVENLDDALLLARVVFGSKRRALNMKREEVKGKRRKKKLDPLRILSDAAWCELNSMEWPLSPEWQENIQNEFGGSFQAFREVSDRFRLMTGDYDVESDEGREEEDPQEWWGGF